MSQDVLRLQDDAWNCGPVAGEAVLAAIGLRTSHLALAALAKSTPTRGTTPTGMQRALGKAGACVSVLHLPTVGMACAWNALVGAVAGGSAALALVDQDTHWTAVIGSCGSRVVVFDPARGPLVYDRAGWLERWHCQGRGGGCYALVCAAGF